MIDKKYLEGLNFKDSDRKTVVENGEKKTIFIPRERKLTIDDVLAFRETETEMIFVTADGQKYTLPLIKGKKGRDIPTVQEATDEEELQADHRNGGQRHQRQHRPGQLLLHH
jgi:hypothetical protein